MDTSIAENLFDDDETLSMICFDIGDHRSTEPEGRAWCISSSSSCCSLCRPPLVSEAEDEQDTKIETSTVQAVGDIFEGHSICDFTFDESLKPEQDNKNSAIVDLKAGADSHHPPTQITYPSCRMRNSAARSLKARQCPNNFTETLDLCRFRCDGFIPVRSISFPAGPNDSNGLDLSAIDYMSPRNLPDDPLFHISTFLDVFSLIQMRECSVRMRAVASHNEAGWKNHCESLWAKKIHVYSKALDLFETTKSPSSISSQGVSPCESAAMNAYKLSVLDAKARNEITVDELCYDGSPEKNGFIWSFRFKESAGQDWTSWDPWWNGLQARKLVFLRDGTIMQIYPEGRGNVRECATGCLYDVFSERTMQRDGANMIPPRIEMKWRFVERPMDLPARPDGAYIRITVGGRDVPTYVARRSPNGNWGFILESCWGVYASFELAPKILPSTNGSNRRRLRRTRNGSRWVNIRDSGSESEGEETVEELTRNVRRRINLFMEESAMSVTGFSQWREALLYNVGAVSLPEGNDVTEEFDEVWQNVVRRR